jgi:hypothetical protein
VSWKLDDQVRDNRKKRWTLKGQVLTKMRKVGKVPFSGKVYNLEVENNHSYVVNGVVVHNCFGTGYSGGFELIENVYCRVRSTPQTLQGDSGGITIKENTTGTIAAYPLLTEADIIIRQHNVRYRVRDIKARATQGYITAQAFNLEKMQLYDMAYRVPAPPIVEATHRLNRGAGVSNVIS